MHLDRLEVRGFGKLMRLAISFSRGMNVIYGDNEAGKTTLQWFVRGMLYGLKSGRHSLYGPPPPQKRFEPWGGGHYGGSLIYVLDDGTSYRVERNFEAGTVELFDSSYNNITGTFGVGRDKLPMIAEHQLGFDEVTFERTVLIRQMMLRLDDNNSGGLAAKLANVSSTGFEDISLYNAEKALTDALKNNIGTGRTRIQPLDKLEIRRRQLEEKYEGLKKQRESRLSVQKEKIAAGNLHERLEMQERYLKHINRLIDIRGELDVYLKKEADLRDTAKKIRELERKISIGIESKLTEQEALPKSYEHPIRRPRTAKADKHSLLVPFLFLAAAALFAGFLGHFTVNGKINDTWIQLLLLGTGLLLSGTAGIVMLIEVMRKKNHQRMAGTIAEPKQSVADARQLFSTSVETELREVTAKLEELSEELEKGIDDACSMDCDPLSYFNTENLDMKICDSDIMSLETSLRAEKEGIRKGLLDAAMREKYCEGLLKDDGEINGELQRVEEETVAIKEKIAYLKHRGKALTLARDVLIEAGHEIKNTFAPDINRNMSRIIKGLTSGKYTDLRGDDRLSLKVAVPEIGEVKNALELSGAAADQMYLALRLAMADLLTVSGESLPLFMDEVFSQFDDSRTELALKYLYSNYHDKQIVLFTCKQREVELVREIYGDRMNLVELGVGVSD